MLLLKILDKAILSIYLIRIFLYNNLYNSPNYSSPLSKRIKTKYNSNNPSNFDLIVIAAI